MQIPQLGEVEAAISKISSVVSVIESEWISIQQADGRVLAEPLVADRDSPAHDVSAMDGYAVNLSELESCRVSGSSDSAIDADSNKPLQLTVGAIAFAGKPPVKHFVGQATQIFTGACVPSGANCIIRREDTDETYRMESGKVTLCVPLSQLKPGQNVRKRGENTREGDIVLAAGSHIHVSTVGSLATFGATRVAVRRKLRVCLLASGDELREPGQTAEAWQIRDSNGPTLRSWLQRLPWTEVVRQDRIRDDLDSVKRSIASAVEASDVVIVTGGVSAGDTDFIPRAIVELGGEIQFHRLPIRPGKPVLGARIGNKLVFGLPGNPVSTAVTARVIAEPVLKSCVGMRTSSELRLPLLNPDQKTLPLTWYRLIQLDGNGARLVDSQGSGDLVSMARSDGFAEIPAGSSGSGPWKVWLW